MGKAMCMTPLRSTPRGKLMVGRVLSSEPEWEWDGCCWIWAKRLLGRPIPKRQVAIARRGERNARRTSSEGPAPERSK